MVTSTRERAADFSEKGHGFKSQIKLECFLPFHLKVNSRHFAFFDAYDANLVYLVLRKVQRNYNIILKLVLLRGWVGK